MRVAALYDVHGNLPALQAVLADPGLAPADALVLGGDLVWGPFPRDTLAVLRQLGERAVWLRGNCDREDDHWSLRQVASADRAALAALPTTVTLDVDGLGAVLFCHGSPRSDEEILTALSPRERVRDATAGVTERVIVCGHTHTQFDREVDDLRLVNAGSVGLSYEDAGPGAYWTLLGPDVAFRRTPFTLDSDAILASGFPDPNIFLEHHSGTEASEHFERQAASSL